MLNQRYWETELRQVFSTHAFIIILGRIRLPNDTQRYRKTDRSHLASVYRCVEESHRWRCCCLFCLAIVVLCTSTVFLSGDSGFFVQSSSSVERCAGIHHIGRCIVAVLATRPTSTRPKVAVCRTPLLLAAGYCRHLLHIVPWCAL